MRLPCALRNVPPRFHCTNIRNTERAPQRRASERREEERKKFERCYAFCCCSTSRSRDAQGRRKVYLARIKSASMQLSPSAAAIIGYHQSSSEVKFVRSRFSACIAPLRGDVTAHELSRNVSFNEGNCLRVRYVKICPLESVRRKCIANPNFSILPAR